MESVELCGDGSGATGVYLTSASSIVAPGPRDISRLFEENLPWAERQARLLKRGLPPSFDVQDLLQIARIEHWRQVQSFDASRGVPYQGYACAAVRGAVLMACRRRHFREATHDRLEFEKPNKR